MLFSLIWADPNIGRHTHPVVEMKRSETGGIWGLGIGALISWLVGAVLIWFGKQAESKIYRKEAMAIVGLSWVLATILGALPYMFSGTARGPSIRISGQRVLVATSNWKIWTSWEVVEGLSVDQVKVLDVVAGASARGVSERQMVRQSGLESAPQLLAQIGRADPFQKWILLPNQNPDAPADRAANYRLAWVQMG
ncbi:MAG: hypothetical protein AAF623_05170, partial [Planctomycetota bacterium]